MIRKYESEYGPVSKSTIPIGTKCHPELGKTPFLYPDGVINYQKLMGIYQWLILSGRIDFCYATSSLSRIQVAPK